ncbi:hypothetical protein EH230_05435 [Flavobacterium columnare]|uniref:Uncharacterized protein n=1 Tax=Flavobacterium columnare TaxID=996 RepID=A0A437U9T6_9FLAO|nr:hypothetical protein [Flavobacterium columnare]RVU90386.1 hypothetical protein EH230_05435 [Flavobacterium columnare]
MLNFIILSSMLLNGQVGIGTVTPEGILDLNSNTNGLVPPRVELTASNIQAPVLNPQGGAIVAGTIVYNTATAGVSPNDVIPGFYYWDGSKWLLLTSQNTSTPTNWSILGNNNTTPTSNFIGTTNNNDFITKTNNIERLRVTNTGNLGIGTASPTSTLDINGSL